MVPRAESEILSSSLAEKENGKMVMYNFWEYATEEYRGKDVKKLRKAHTEGLLYRDLVRELQRISSFPLHNTNAVNSSIKCGVNLL